MKVLVLATGGTIDDLEYAKASDAPENRESIIPLLLEQINHGSDTIFEELMMKDSDFITNDDRQVILERIQRAEENKILITHGTNTICDTAKYLGDHINDKTVVLTGSMTLPSVDESKEALSSLEFALNKIQSLPDGVFVAMQEKIFNWNNVRKNMEEGKFELAHY